MAIDLTKGLDVKIEGELGANQTLSISALVEIVQSFQDVINTIATHGLDTPIDVRMFELELVGFQKSSAVPQLRMVQPKQEALFTEHYKNGVKQINQQVEDVLNISDVGNYPSVVKFCDNWREKEGVVKLTESLYRFQQSFKGSPAVISNLDTYNKKPKYRYVPKPFDTAQKRSIISKIRGKDDSLADKEVIAEFRTAIVEVKQGTNGKTKKKIKSTYSPVFQMYYDTKTVSNSGLTLHFKEPLLSKTFLDEDKDVNIVNERLSLHVIAKNEEQAKKHFDEDLIFLYQFVMGKPDRELAKHYISAKNFLKEIVVKGVEYGSR